MPDWSGRYFLAIRNWEKYQHYKKGDRNVRWIKLYTNLLFDPDFNRLSSLDQLFFIKCLLLAPSVENRFPIDMKWWKKWERFPAKRIQNCCKSVAEMEQKCSRSVSFLHLFCYNSENQVVEVKDFNGDLDSILLEQSRLYKENRVETPIVPLPEKSKNKSRQAAPDLTLFNRFWAAYPRHENKAMAIKAWSKLNGEGDWLLDSILYWLDQAKTSKQWQDKSLIPHPSTFLNQRRWEGDPPPAEPCEKTLFEQMWGYKDPKGPS